MDKQLLSFDQMTGLSTYHNYDPLTDETHIITEGDAGPTIEENRSMANDTDFSRKGIRDDMWLYARIPAIIQHKWLVEDGLNVWNKDHGARLSRKLEDPDWKYLKTTTGHHRFK